jgi:hypothetical protein
VQLTDIGSRAMPNLDEALANDPHTKTLYIDFADREALDERIAALTQVELLSLGACPGDLVLPRALLALPALKTLRLRPRKKAPLVVPALVAELHLHELDVSCADATAMPWPRALTRLVWHAPEIEHQLAAIVAGLPHLEQLELCARVDDFAPLAALARLDTLAVQCSDLGDDVRALVPHVPNLRDLTICGVSRGDRETRGALPPELATLARLEKLCLGCAASALPDTLPRLARLRELHLSELPALSIPDVVGELPALEVLAVADQVAGLPASFAKLTHLRELHLRSALNKGALVSRWDSIDKLKPLPRVLSQLTGLEVLNLGCCGVTDLAPLAPLTKLRVLDLEWSAFATVAPLAGLVELEELNLEHCDRVADLAPLAGLSKLRELNLADTRPKSLDVLRALPALAKLNISTIDCENLDPVYALDVALEADDEVLAQYAQRAVLRALPPIGDITAALASPGLAVVETALDQLATWVTASSKRDGSAIGSSGALPALDAALDRHLAQLSPAVLVRVFRCAFHASDDDHDAAVRAAGEVARRGDEAAQLALAEAFEHAHEHYDPGHRSFESTTQDRLIDDVLPQLGGRALARLVAWCSDGHLAEDQLAALFAPAIERSRGDDREAVANRLAEHVEYRAQYQRPDDVAGLFASLAEVAGPEAQAAVARVKASVEDKLAAQRRRTDLDNQLSSKDPGQVSAALTAVAALPTREAKRDVQGALWKANKCEQLDPGALRALLAVWRELDHGGGLAEAIALAGRGGAAGRAVVAELGLPAGDLAATLREQSLDTRRDGAHRIEHASNRWNDEPETPETERAMAEVRAEVAATCTALHEWANELEGISVAEGLAREATAALARLGHFDRERVIVAIEVVAACDGYAPPAGAKLSGLADDLGVLADHEDLLAPFGQLARHLHKLHLRDLLLERVLAQLIAIAMRSSDDGAVAALQPLVPEQVEWDILAFNLACFHATRGTRADMLRYTRRALELGKSPTQFTSDSDFAASLEDAEFRAILDAAL